VDAAVTRSPEAAEDGEGIRSRDDEHHPCGCIVCAVAMSDSRVDERVFVDDRRTPLNAAISPSVEVARNLPATNAIAAAASPYPLQELRVDACTAAPRQTARRLRPRNPRQNPARSRARQK